MFCGMCSKVMSRRRTIHNCDLCGRNDLCKSCKRTHLCEVRVCY